MTLLEYVTSLQEQGLPGEEVIAKTQEWKKKNNYGVSEQPSVLKEDLKPKEEAKIDDVADKKDATVTSTSDASKAIEEITGQSKFGTGPSALPDPKQSFDLVGRTAYQIAGITPIFQGVDLNPGEIKKANKYEYKYEIGEDKQPVFYTKKEGQQDWSNVTANKAKNPGAELGVAEELGFNVGDFDREKELQRKKIKKDFEIGDILSNAKLEAPKPYIEEVGKFLGPSEIEARQKAKKARIAIGVEDLDLDKKISDSIYENNLDVDNFYSQFKDKDYSGKYVQDLGPNIYKKTFEDLNPDKINNFTSSDEFLGFLQEKGYMQDYIDTVYGPGLTLAEGDDIQKFKIGKQRKLDSYFKLYIQETNSKYTNQVLLSYIVKNKEKFKNVKSLSEAYDLAKKYFEKEYGQSTFEAVSYNDYNSYREEEFPELVSAEKKLQAARKAKSEELIKEGSSEGLLQDGFNKFYDGVISRATEQAYELREALGFDMGYATLLDTEENIKKSAEDVRYGYIEGKKAEIDGVEYIKDSNGSIYNVTNKVAFIPSNAKEFEKINKAIEGSDETGSSFSAAGSTEQFLATSGTMLFDIASIYGVGKFTKATKLGTLTNAIRIPKASFDTMSYYTFAGYVSSKKNIYEELIAAGVNETEARAVAEEGARVGGLWTGGTSLIAPIPSYLKQFDKILGNRSILQSAIKGYKKNGPTGFINNFKETLKNIKITKDGVIKTGIAGTQEFAQEQVQQYGEITGVNAYVNRLLGKDILKETYNRQDFINTGIVSFASGSAFANLNIPGFKPSAAQQLNNLYVLGKDTTQTQKLLNEMVAEGKATQEEAGKVMSGIRSVKNQMSRIPASISAETKLESARLQQDIADLQAKKSRTDEVYHDSIDSQIDAKKKELAEIVKPELEKMAARKGAKKAAEQLGAGFENFSTQQDMDSAAESLTEDGWEVQDSTGYGMALTKGKQKIILINDQAAAEDNRYTTDQHEVLHPFWEAALKANPEAAISLGKALMVEIINNKDISVGTELLSRFSGYLSDENYSAENTWEEVIPLVSEALSNGDITYNKKQEAWWENLGTKITNFLKGNKKPLSLEFNTGKDVFEFIKGYNKTIEAGKGLTKEQLEVSEKGAKGKLIEEGFDQESTYTVKEGETIQDVADKFDTTVQNLKDLNKTSGVDLKAGDNLIVDRGVKIVERASEIKAAQQIKESVAKESKRIEDSQEVQRLYDDQGVSAAFDIIQKFKPITSRIVESRSQAPNFDRELLTGEIETGPRGILDLITEYKPESGVPLAAYINKFLPARAIEASKRVLGEEFTTDVTEARGVVAEETTEVKTKEKPLAKKPTETVEFSQAQVERIGAKDKTEVETKITEATKDGFKGKSITRFGETRNVPKAVADIYAGMFGLNPQTITDKTRNYQKTDAEGLTTAKQFLLKNANNDFARLPKTKDGFGKGTFLPRNVMNALYTDGKLTGTLKDYMDLIRQKPVKPIYRDAVGQTIRGLLNLHIRNRMFEDLVTTTPERLRGGAKFSKRINTEQQVFEDKQLNDLFKSVSQAKSIIDVAKIIGVKGKITVNDSNRAQKQEQMLDFIKSGSIPSAVFEMAKFQNFARRKVNGVYVDLPARGGLYYGKSDPAYQAALNAAKENDSKYPDLAKPKRVNVNKAFTKEGIKQSKENTKFLNSFVNILNDAVNKNGLPIEIAALYITSGYQATTGIIKIAAPFRYKSTKFEYAGPGGKGSDNKGEKFREEHTIPASVIGANIILAIQKNAVKPTMKAIEKNYFQVQLSKKDDTKLDKAGLDSTLFENQTIFDSPISRLAAAGINLQTIINPLNSKTIAEENGVGINSKIYNSLSLDAKTQASAIQNEQIKKGALDESYNVKEAIDLLIPLSENKAKASKRNSNTQPSSLQEGFVPVEKSIENLEVLDNALDKARRPDAPVKKIRVFDFDDTLARSKSMVIVNMPDGSSRKINATEFAAEAANLEEQGAEFDFSEFSKVVDGKKGPLFSVAEKIAAARGTDDIFILTARPADAASPIQAFMKANGIDLKLENIVGLGDGTAAAKGRWIASKAAEGYNDFYFADDAIKNVQAVKDVLSQVDVKSKVQQAKASKRITFNTIVNEMIEDSSGIESFKTFSEAKAKTIGKNKGRFDFFIPPSAEDFTGLLYKMIGKGKKGDAQFAFLKNNLIDTYNRAESAVTQAKISAANDFIALKAAFPSIPKTLEVETGIGKFTYQHAIRSYIWDQQGMSVPGLSKSDMTKLKNFIISNPELQVFADQLIELQKGKPYPKPTSTWLAGNITTDVIGGINKVNRKEYLQEWQDNVDIIFSDQNLNKMEAAYGSRWREALEDSLRRMKSGSNRPLGGDRVTEQLLDWLNNSVGAVMFLNTRSALLQTISAVNFINWGDNNIVKAGRAFANQKQFWKDFMTLMNSDYLVERREGLKINISESEIADAVRNSPNKAKSFIALALNKGFIFTRYADSFAIATGGASFYRNRIKSLMKQGMSEADAEKQAFEDFRAISEESQQSSSPQRISKQQASAAGRVILAWANTPMQYARIEKRAIQDIINGRGDWKSNVSKIVYYAAVQNLIFNALQQSLFALGFGDDDEEEEAKAKKKLDKTINLANGMIDSQLRGLGIGGSAVVAVKNALAKIYSESEKKTPEFEKAALDLLSFSPPLSSKYRKIAGGLKSFSWNRKAMKEKGFSLDNPAYLAGAQIISGTTNIPLDRVIKKINNIRGIISEKSRLWQKVALAAGWSTWDVGLPYYGGYDPEPELTPKQKLQADVEKMKKDTTKKQQVDVLLNLGLTKKQIKSLKYENDRVKKIIELQNKKKDGKNKS